MKSLIEKAKSEESSNGIEKGSVQFYEVTNLGVITINELLKSCVNTGLSPDSFLKFIELSVMIEDAINMRMKLMKILMNSYGIEKPVTTPVSVIWKFDDHEKKAEISQKLNAINNQIVKLTPTNFIPSKEFFAFTSQGVNGQPLPMDKVMALSKLLMKK